MQRFTAGFLAWATLSAGGAVAACDEVGYLATFEVANGQEQAFEEAIVKVAAKVLETEPGTVFYAPYRGDDGKYYMMERYRDLAAREAHAKHPDVLALFGPVMPTLAADIRVTPVTRLCADDGN
jgi:quinol monooxygenase YgiN